VVRTFMLGEDNPLATWQPVFDGMEVSGEAEDYPRFDAVLDMCRGNRAWTIALMNRLTERRLGTRSARPPRGHESQFGTYRDCLQYVAVHTPRTSR